MAKNKEFFDEEYSEETSRISDDMWDDLEYCEHEYVPLNFDEKICKHCGKTN